MRCYVFIQTTKLHIFSIYGNFLLFIFYFLKDMRTEEQVFLKDIRTEEHVLSLNQRTCSSVLLSYPPQAIPMFFCSPVLSLASNPHVLMFSCLIPASNPHVLLSNYHAHFSYSN